MFQLEHAIEAVECIDGMGDHEDAAAGGVLERASHHPARQGRVEVGDGFVEDQEACVGQQRSGQREALALAAGDELTLMADERVEAVLDPVTSAASGTRPRCGDCAASAGHRCRSSACPRS